MPVTDTWATWTSTAGSNSPAGTATPEIDDELRNIKAQVKANVTAVTDIQSGSHIYAASAVGSDSYAITLAPDLTAYANGQLFCFKADVANTGACTLQIEALTATAIKKYVIGTPTALETGDIVINQKCWVYYDSDASAFILLNPATINAPSVGTGVVSNTEFSYLDGVTSAIQTQLNAITSGKTVQIVTTPLTGAVATGTTLFPIDDTIPQNDEGDEFMTLAITPDNALDILYIDVTMVLAHSAAGSILGIGLFQDSTADALAAVASVNPTANAPNTICLRHSMVAGTTSATTFKVRAGSSAGSSTVTFNGFSSNRIFGGICASKIKITENRPS